MAKQNSETQKAAAEPDGALPGAEHRRGGAVDEDVLSATSEQLERLRIRTHELRTLRDRECALEVECLVAEAALKSIPEGAIQGLDPDQVADLAEALDKKRRLQRTLDMLASETSLEGQEGLSEPGPLVIGQEALRAWLEAPDAMRRQTPPRIFSAVLMVAVLATVWAALTVHLAFLVILIPLGLPLAYLRWSRQDSTWLRLGAQRRFIETGLEPPSAWEASSVRARLSEIQSLIDRASQSREKSTPAQLTGGIDTASATADLAETERAIEAALGEMGLASADLGGELDHWLTLVGRARHVRADLEQVRTRRAGVSAEAEGMREVIFRFLSREGEAPQGARADLDALATGLERVAERGVSQRRKKARSKTGDDRDRT